MVIKRSKGERGHVDAGWLKAKHSFSFGEYHDPQHMGFGPLRVINEDRVAPGTGFGTHPHKNMEIITWPLAGGIRHEDSMGNGAILRPGDIQVMSAGRGLTHSEMNASKSDELHLLQIWIMPNEHNTEPGYEDRTLDPSLLQNRFQVLASADGEDGSIKIKQDARVLAGRLDAGNSIDLTLDPTRKYWVQIARGEGTVATDTAAAGDGFAIFNETELNIRAEDDSEVLLFDMVA